MTPQPVLKISVGIVKLNRWMDRNSGNLSHNFWEGFRSAIFCVCIAATRVMLFKVKSGHVTSLLRCTVFLPVTQVKAHIKPAKAIIICPSCPPSLISPPRPPITILHPHQPSCFWDTWGAAHFRVFLLAVPSAWNCLPPRCAQLAPSASLSLWWKFQCE